MSQTENRAPGPELRFSVLLKTLLKKLGGVLIRNWPMKLLALVLSVALWAGLIARDPTLTREKEFRDVHVSIMNEESFKLQGYIVTTELGALLDDVTLRVEVPQKQYADMKASAFNVRVDLSELEPRAGEQSLSILADSSTANGAVTRLSPSSVTVTVEEYIIRDYIPVNVVTTGEPPEGYYVDPEKLTCDPAWVTVSGPRSLVEDVASAEVVLNLSELPDREGTVANSLTFTLVDGDGESVSGSMLQVTRQNARRDYVNVSIRVYAKRDVEVLSARLYLGVPAEGYEVTDVFVNPSYVTVAGRSSVLDTLTLLQPSELVNVSGKTETVIQTVNLSLPDKLEWFSATQVSVTVVIQPRQKTVRIPEVPIQVDGLTEGYTAQVEPSSALVRVTGEEAWVGALEASAVTLSCDVTGLTEGVHEGVPLNCVIAGSEEQNSLVEVEPLSVRVTITPAGEKGNVE